MLRVNRVAQMNQIQTLTYRFPYKFGVEAYVQRYERENELLQVVFRNLRSPQRNTVGLLTILSEIDQTECTKLCEAINLAELLIDTHYDAIVFNPDTWEQTVTHQYIFEIFCKVLYQLVRNQYEPTKFIECLRCNKKLLVMIYVELLKLLILYYYTVFVNYDENTGFQRMIDALQLRQTLGYRFFQQHETNYIIMVNMYKQEVELLDMITKVLLEMFKKTSEAVYSSFDEHELASTQSIINDVILSEIHLFNKVYSETNLFSYRDAINLNTLSSNVLILSIFKIIEEFAYIIAFLYHNCTANKVSHHYFVPRTVSRMYRLALTAPFIHIMSGSKSVNEMFCYDATLMLELGERHNSACQQMVLQSVYFINDQYYDSNEYITLFIRELDIAQENHATLLCQLISMCSDIVHLVDNCLGQSVLRFLEKTQAPVYEKLSTMLELEV